MSFLAVPSFPGWRAVGGLPQVVVATGSLLRGEQGIEVQEAKYSIGEIRDFTMLARESSPMTASFPPPRLPLCGLWLADIVAHEYGKGSASQAGER
jgi:hypothetical protein